MTITNSNCSNCSDLEEKQLKNKTMNVSIIEGSAANIALTLGDNYITPYMLSLNASSAEIGVLSSLSGILSPATQILGSRLMEKFSRKGILCTGVLLQSLIWPLFMLIGFLFFKNFIQNDATYILMGFYLMYVCFGAIVGPSWFSEMGDVVPENYRGRYFAKRNIITTIFALISTITISFALDYFKSSNQVFFGFMIVFIIGFISRLISLFGLTKYYYPPLKIEKEEHVSFKQFFKGLTKSNIGHFSLFVTMIYFGQMIAGPFFNIYMLKDLSFSYTSFITVNLSQSFILIFLYSFLGKFGDKYGNVRLLQIGSILIPVLPILWLFLDSPVELILGPQLIGAFGWGSFNLAASNFIYDNVPSHKRGYYVAYYNFIVGIGILAGGFLGSMIITLISINFMHEFLFLFLLSGIVRATVVIIFLPKIKEVRKDIVQKPILLFRSTLAHKAHFTIFNKHQHLHKELEHKE